MSLRSHEGSKQREETGYYHGGDFDDEDDVSGEETSVEVQKPLRNPQVKRHQADSDALDLSFSSSPSKNNDALHIAAATAAAVANSSTPTPAGGSAATTSQTNTAARKPLRYSPTLELWNSVSGTLNGNPMRVFLLVLGVLVFVLLNPPSRTIYPNARDVLSKVQDMPILKDAMKLVGLGPSKPAVNATVIVKQDVHDERNSRKPPSLRTKLPHSTANTQLKSNPQSDAEDSNSDSRPDDTTAEEDEDERDDDAENQNGSAKSDVPEQRQQPQKQASGSSIQQRISPTTAGSLSATQQRAGGLTHGGSIASTTSASSSQGQSPDVEIRDLPDQFTAQGQKRRSELKFLGYTSEEIFAQKRREAIEQSKVLRNPSDTTIISPSEIKMHNPKALVTEAIAAQDREDALQIATAARVAAAAAGVSGTHDRVVRLPDDVPPIGHDEPSHPDPTHSSSSGPEPPHDGAKPNVFTTRYRVLPVNLFQRLKDQVKRNMALAAAAGKTSSPSSPSSPPVPLNEQEPSTLPSKFL